MTPTKNASNAESRRARRSCERQSNPAEPERNRPPTRPFYWSVRRELWENRSIYIAPLIVAGVSCYSAT